MLLHIFCCLSFPSFVLRPIFIWRTLYMQILFYCGVIITSKITFGRFLVIRSFRCDLLKVRRFLNVELKRIHHIIYSPVEKFMFNSQMRYFYEFHSFPLITKLLTIDKFCLMRNWNFSLKDNLKDQGLCGFHVTCSYNSDLGRFNVILMNTGKI